MKRSGPVKWSRWPPSYFKTLDALMRTGSGHSFVHVKCLLPSRKGREKTSCQAEVWLHAEEAGNENIISQQPPGFNIKALVNMNLNEL